VSERAAASTDGPSLFARQYVDAGGRAIGDERQRHCYGGVSSQLSRVIGCRAARQQLLPFG
jgi:hypothetical protein